MDPNFIENSKQSIFSKGAESGSNQGHFLTLQIKFYNFYEPIIAIFIPFFFLFLYRSLISIICCWLCGGKVD